MGNKYSVDSISTNKKQKEAERLPHKSGEASR
jgi:hypothetical protein